jgi:hypothetical protein
MSNCSSSVCSSSYATSGALGASSVQDSTSQGTRKRLREAESNPERKLPRLGTPREERQRRRNMVRMVVQVTSSKDLLGHLMQFVPSTAVYRLATVSKIFSEVSKQIQRHPCPSDASDDTRYRFPMVRKASCQRDREIEIGCPAGCREETLTATCRCYSIHVGSRAKWYSYLSDAFPRMTRDDVQTVLTSCKDTIAFGLFCRASFRFARLDYFQGQLLDSLACQTMDMHSIFRLFELGVCASQLHYLEYALRYIDIHTIFQLLELGPDCGPWVSPYRIRYYLVDVLRHMDITTVIRLLELGVEPKQIRDNLVDAANTMDMQSIFRLLELGVNSFELSHFHTIFQLLELGPDCGPWVSPYRIRYHLVDVLRHMDINTVIRLLELGVEPKQIRDNLVDAAKHMDINRIQTRSPFSVALSTRTAPTWDKIMYNGKVGTTGESLQNTLVHFGTMPGRPSGSIAHSTHKAPSSAARSTRTAPSSVAHSTRTAPGSVARSTRTALSSVARSTRTAPSSIACSTSQPLNGRSGRL